jgi:predicted RNA binding protein YcfA (HicA-like mRNA interferase family)
MTRKATDILEQARRSQASVRFSDLVKLVEAAGYNRVRQRGSHIIFAHGSRKDLPIVNLQADGPTAKPYQVRQVLRIIDENKLEVR